MLRNFKWEEGGFELRWKLSLEMFVFKFWVYEVPNNNIISCIVVLVQTMAIARVLIFSVYTSTTELATNKQYKQASTSRGSFFSLKITLRIVFKWIQQERISLLKETRTTKNRSYSLDTNIIKNVYYYITFCVLLNILSRIPFWTLTVV